MCDMFGDASSFNQSLNSWEVSSVVNMKSMFSGATLFDKDNALWYDLTL